MKDLILQNKEFLKQRAKFRTKNQFRLQEIGLKLQAKFTSKSGLKITYSMLLQVQVIMKPYICLLVNRFFKRKLLLKQVLLVWIVACIIFLRVNYQDQGLMVLIKLTHPRYFKKSLSQETIKQETSNTQFYSIKSRALSLAPETKHWTLLVFPASIVNLQTKVLMFDKPSINSYSK